MTALITRHNGFCRMCRRGHVKVRHINLQVFGPEGLIICKNCELKLVNFAKQQAAEHMDTLEQVRIKEET